MQLDIATLFSLLVIQALALALLLPLLMGWRTASRGARLALLSMGLQGAGWLALLAAPLMAERLLGTLAMALISASLSALWLALGCWLGAARGRRLMLALPALIALAYALLYESYALRVGVSNAGFGLQLLWLCALLARPLRNQEPALTRRSRRWRGSLLVCLLLLAVLTVWRGALAAFDTAAYPSFYSPHPVNVLAAVLSNVALVLSLASVLVAWRGEIEAAFVRRVQSDTLTGLPNRQAFTDRAVDMMAMARRYQEPLLLSLFSPDGLKPLGEQQGMEPVERQLQRFAQCLEAQLRPGDLLARVGEDAFAVLLARSDDSGPQALHQRLSQALRESGSGGPEQALNYSAGWARLRHGDRDIEDLLRRADAALHSARRSGGGGLAAEPGAEQ
jgi:diguanylate cyclase (GGDEF)-like protein